MKKLTEKEFAAMTKWIDKTTKKMAHPLLVEIEKYERTHCDAEIAVLVGNLTSILVNKMVTNSLGLRRDEMPANEEDSKDVSRRLSAKFNHARKVVEENVAAAFELGMSEFSDSNTMFRCVIDTVEEPRNKLPC
jgi:hypothetical protein